MNKTHEDNIENVELQEKKYISGKTQNSTGEKLLIGVIDEGDCYWYNKGLIEDVQDGRIKYFVMITIAGVIFLAVELFGAYFSNSIAVLSEAAHLFSDLTGFWFSVGAATLAKQKATERHSYGYHRAEILGVLTNCQVVLTFTVILGYISIIRIIYPPEEFDSSYMMFAAIFGLVVHLGMMKFLHDSPTKRATGVSEKEEMNVNQQIFARELESWMSKTQTVRNPANSSYSKGNENFNPNSKAAFIQIFCEILHSIFVVMSSLIIQMVPHWIVVDPICTQVCGFISIVSTISGFRTSLYLLMESSPQNFELNEFTDALQTIPGLGDIHDQHVWSLSQDKITMSAHMRGSNPEEILQKATVVCRKFGIYHSTIQVEKDEQTVRGNQFFIDCGHNLHD